MDKPSSETLAALDALDELAQRWSERVGIPDMASHLAKSGSAEYIQNMIEQAFVEGAYHAWLSSPDERITPDDARLSQIIASERQAMLECAELGSLRK